ncbi:helix-turn-helix transcriptional regulator [Aquimarina algiphila]|uniref:Helix-turn-helix transcriptional regulator n=1 Tax=Aquimarina algiphila TaxID=2047982 RepID=A0A554VCF8_9FLAO|nr:helix-turn-helix transcriptional regulator [Aquimarina algiphila]TSE04369.1 helix-turn-helix transcriptional regulator [Aquimarina algiphila]
MTQQELFVTEVVKRLSEERKRQGLSYERLGEKAVVHRTTISLIERGKQTPTLSLCKKLADSLDIKLSDIIAECE